MSESSSNADFNELLTYLYALQRRGIKVGLEHTRRLLTRCDNPHFLFESIHIAGTNGKGSTAAMIASILKEAGFKVGLYTSPHLVRFNERIRVNGVPITELEIVRFVTAYRSDFEEVESTFFETTTAMAFWHFAQKQVDIAVVETGLGGRLDSTNVLEPCVAVVTPVAVDHTELLGKDIATIAFEKGGIIKEHIPLVLADQTTGVRNVLLEIAARKAAPVTEILKTQINITSIDDSGSAFFWKGEPFHAALIGAHQALNAAVAVQAVSIFNQEIGNCAVQNGLIKVNWPARLQRLHRSLPIYYDVAHNPHGIQAVMRALNTMYPEQPVGVMLLKADKELDQIIPILMEHFAEIVISSVADAGVMSAGELEQALESRGVACTRIDHLDQAISALKKKTNRATPGLIFGSHYIGKAVYQIFDFSFDNGVI